MRKRKSQIGIVGLGIVVILMILFLQIKHNIINNNFIFICVVNCIWGLICYIYIRTYKTKDDDYMIVANKTVLLYGLEVAMVSVTGILSKVRYAHIDNMFIVYFSLLYMLVYYVSSMVLFFKNEKSTIYKYVLLVGFVGMNIITINVGKHWIFFTCLPMMVVFTIYGERIFTLIAGTVVGVMTLYGAIVQTIVNDETKKDYYYLWLYLVIFILIFFIVMCTLSSSNVIGMVNKSRVREVKEEKNKTQHMSANVINTGIDIQNESENTASIMNNFNELSNKSRVLFDDILKENEENVNSTKIQMNMTSQIIEMINDVKERIDLVKNIVKLTHSGVIKSKISVDEVNNKSINIIEKNKKVRVAMREFENNIAKIKGFVSDIEEIAGQTDLLSLNAAIESQRGELYNKEFSLVANEVKKLSDETAKLLNDINNIVYRLEDNTSRVNNVINEVEGAVGFEYETIEENISKLNNMNRHIEKIENNINDIFLKVINVAEHSKNIGKASIDLHEHSDRTNDMVNKLVLNNEESISKIIKTKELVDELDNKGKELQV